MNDDDRLPKTVFGDEALGEPVPNGGGLPDGARGSAPTVPIERKGRSDAPIDAFNDPAWTTRHERYVDVERLGHGGMSEVWRVRDVALGRVVAMKKLPPEFSADPKSHGRFLHEMRTTAALQHPGIVAVHDSGELPDGRLWFTMKEVRGVTFRVAIRELHYEQSEKWTLRRVIEAFARVCEAVAYAHSREVVHRDLKPENLMVGEFGEVLVMDWGLVKNLRVRGPSRPKSFGMELSESIDTQDSIDSIDSVDTLSPLQTLPGDVMGTPAYMAPEQALGHLDRIGYATDVYALGAVLYEILCGRPPYVGSVRVVWSAVKAGPPAPLEKHANSFVPIPPELSALCARAMARNPEDRFADAGLLGTEVRAWLDGAYKRERALALVHEARRVTPKLDRMKERAQALTHQAREVLGGLKSFAPASAKAEGWALEDEAAALRREAALEEVGWLQALRSALNEAPDLKEAHEMLADHYRSRLAAAEEERDTDSAVQWEAFLRVHDRGKHASFLSGQATITLVTEPAGAQVSLYRYVENERVLVPEYEGELGQTPLHEVRVSKGSYLLKARAPGFHELSYPVFVGRGEHWSGAPPGENSAAIVHLLPLGELESDSVFVPAGWFIAGGDSMAAESFPRMTLWCEAFVVNRYPITNAQYLTFLNDLVARGREQEALAACPRVRLGLAAVHETPLLFPRDFRGNFQLSDREEKEQQLEWPVAFVDWHGAVRYAAWISEKTGKSWRLLNELEWEKAARGVDGRLAPWGDHIDPSFACMLGSQDANPTRVRVNSFPVDTSPYGVRGMAGNVRDWCINVWKADGPQVQNGRLLLDPASLHDPEARSARGGTWTTAPAFCRVAARFADKPSWRFGGVGFRLARSV